MTYQRFVRRNGGEAALDMALRELPHVDDLARRLRLHLERKADDVDAHHVHGAKSGDIQAIVSTLLRAELGFAEEEVLTTDEGFVTKARPDFYFRLTEGRGVLAEVERGGTVNNNHDLKDLWKAHISPRVQHLFLVVPRANWKADGAAREKPFDRVVHRLGAFFGEERCGIDVWSAHVFGYGRAG